MKLYVEMSEKEYEKFKQFTNGNYVKPSGNREDICLYLEKSGFKYADCSTDTDRISGKITATINFQKGNTTVLIVQRNLQKYEEEE